MSYDEAIEFARATEKYLREFSELYLSSTGSYPFQVDLPVIPVLQQTFLEALYRMREGKTLDSEKHENALHDAVSTLIEKFEAHYQQVQSRRAKELGVSIPFRVMTRGETEHLRMFVQYLLVQDATAHSTGTRAMTYEKMGGRDF